MVESLTCRLCGHRHQGIALAAGETALCVRCSAPLARGDRFGSDTAPACALAGLLFAGPALTLPLVRVAKFGDERACSLLTGARLLWRDGMPELAGLVALCGCFAPLLLLALIASLHLPGSLGRKEILRPRLLSLARGLGVWAMPEVQLLAILVGFFKLANLVDVTVGPGLWCYAGMAAAILLAGRGFEFERAGS
jgi:paraquat-inducible protein A